MRSVDFQIRCAEPERKAFVNGRAPARYYVELKAKEEGWRKIGSLAMYCPEHKGFSDETR